MQHKTTIVIAGLVAIQSGCFNERYDDTSSWTSPDEPKLNSNIVDTHPDLGRNPGIATVSDLSIERSEVFQPHNECTAPVEIPDVAFSWAHQDAAGDRLEIDVEHITDSHQRVRIYADITTEIRLTKKILLADIMNTGAANKRISADLIKLGLTNIGPDQTLANITIYAEVIAENKLSTSHNALSINVRRESGQFVLRPTNHVIALGKDGDSTWEEMDGLGPSISGKPIENEDERNDIDAEYRSDSRHIEARAISDIRYCIRIGATYTDVDFGEDFWTSSGTYFRIARGMLATIYRNGVLYEYRYLDIDGCTPYYSDTGTYTISVQSRGKIGSVNIHVKDDNNNYLSTSFSHYHSGANDIPITHTKNFSGNWSRTNVYLVAAESFRVHSTAMGASTVNYVVGEDGNFHNSGTVWINSDQSKFTIAHESGHAFAFHSVPSGNLNGNDCSLNDPMCPDPMNSSHSMTSKEFQGCSLQEGFAEYYSADIWNSHASSADCRYRTHDCEDDNTHVFRYMEQNCVGTASPVSSGRGTDIDWLRQLWDVHTNGGTTSINDMVDWIEDSGSHSATNVYSLLNTEANAYGGNLDSNWDAVKGINGVDHP